jgi:hypothetical protein
LSIYIHCSHLQIIFLLLPFVPAVSSLRSQKEWQSLQRHASPRSNAGSLVHTHYWYTLSMRLIFMLCIFLNNTYGIRGRRTKMVLKQSLNNILICLYPLSSYKS